MNTIRLNRHWPEVPVLHEDETILALNKPAGLLIAPDRWDKRRDNIMTLLAAARPGEYLANVHRLDFNTSGVFLLAKTKPALIQIARQFHDHTVRKTYTALVQGFPENQTIELPIGPSARHRGLVRIDHKAGKPATTIIRVTEKYRQHSLLTVEIQTGRQHQIRVHLQAIGYPVVGDTDYGGLPLLLSQIKRKYKAKEEEEERPLIAKPALHAEQLTINHPATNTPVTIKADWPKNLAVAVKYLRQYAQ